jgi:hypothetical protein
MLAAISYGRRMKTLIAIGGAEVLLLILIGTIIASYKWERFLTSVGTQRKLQWDQKRMAAADASKEMKSLSEPAAPYPDPRDKRRATLKSIAFWTVLVAIGALIWQCSDVAPKG